MKDFKRASGIVEYLRHFASLSDVATADATVTVLHDEWCELEVVIRSQRRLIWYHWDTTA